MNKNQTQWKQVSHKESIYGDLWRFYELAKFHYLTSLLRSLQACIMKSLIKYLLSGKKRNPAIMEKSETTLRQIKFLSLKK